MGLLLKVSGNYPTCFCVEYVRDRVFRVLLQGAHLGCCLLCIILVRGLE
jgi:hypothetical protein